MGAVRKGGHYMSRPLFSNWQCQELTLCYGLSCALQKFYGEALTSNKMVLGDETFGR